jgi:hypothetical protein
VLLASDCKYLGDRKHRELQGNNRRDRDGLGDERRSRGAHGKDGHGDKRRYRAAHGTRLSFYFGLISLLLFSGFVYL